MKLWSKEAGREVCLEIWMTIPTRKCGSEFIVNKCTALRTVSLSWENTNPLHYKYNPIMQFFLINILTLSDLFWGRWVNVIRKYLLEMQNKGVPRRKGGAEWWLPQKSRQLQQQDQCQAAAYARVCLSCSLLPDPTSCWLCPLQHAQTPRANLRNYLIMQSCF